LRASSGPCTRAAEGLLLVDKPKGCTSHDVVAAIRRAAPTSKAGHAGTLDPLATGLLLVCLGRATRLMRYLVGHDKEYCVVARLGAESETYDAEGRLAPQRDAPLPDDLALGEAIAAMVGVHEQVPPRFSAAKVRGRPLYEYARTGRSVPRQPRAKVVTVYNASWTRLAPDAVGIRLTCSAGTYVRVLVHEFGQRLGCGAYVAELRRLRSGPFSVGEALPLEEWVAKLRAGDFSAVLPLREALRGMPAFQVSEEEVAGLQHGRPLVGRLPGGAVGEPHAVLGPDGELVAVVKYRHEDKAWYPEVVLSTAFEG